MNTFKNRLRINNINNKLKKKDEQKCIALIDNNMWRNKIIGVDRLIDFIPKWFALFCKFSQYLRYSVATNNTIDRIVICACNASSSLFIP